MELCLHWYDNSLDWAGLQFYVKQNMIVTACGCQMCIQGSYMRATIAYNAQNNNNMYLDIIIESLLCGCSCMHVYCSM